ncbi:MAG: serine/threonine-protein kinase [Pyrinomonadaceae bacterium]
MIEAGTILQNRYRVEKQIGQGGMGAVFVATDERFGSTVAIKETLMLDEKFRKAFEREARLLNSLRHPALPRVSDHFVDGNGQFLVMEYIDGEDLSEMMEHEGKVYPLKDVLNWADQLLDALEYLHTQEMPVIHRDIKPQNLKLNSRGQIILLDFGLAKGNLTSPESNTAAKSVFGYSRNYASLEQIQGTGTDPRSDLYSLSATLYHLLTGVPPADALTRAMNVLSDKQDPLVAMNTINADIPEPVAEVLHKSMALNANQRPISAQAMRAMLWESQESVAEDAKTVPDKRLAANLFTQKTAVLGDSNPQQSSIKTEVLAENVSQETAVKPRTTGDFEAQATRIQPLAQQSAGRKTATGAKVFVALLLAGCAAAAIFYSFNPGIFGAGSSNPANTNTGQNVNPVTASESNTNTTETNANVSTEIANTNGATDLTRKEETKKPEVKQTEKTTAETSKSQAKGTGNQITIEELNELNEMDDADDEDETTVGNTPKIRPVPGSPNKKEQIPPFVFQKMTPAQRQQLKQALEIQRQQREQQRREREKRQQQPPQVAPPN